MIANTICPSLPKTLKRSNDVTQAQSIIQAFSSMRPTGDETDSYDEEGGKRIRERLRLLSNATLNLTWEQSTALYQKTIAKMKKRKELI